MPRPLKGAVLEHTGRQVTRVLRTVEHYEPKSKRELASLCGLERRADRGDNPRHEPRSGCAGHRPRRAAVSRPR